MNLHSPASLLIILVSLASCGCSVTCFRNALYSDDVLIDEPSLEGKWAKAFERDDIRGARDFSVEKLDIKRIGKGTYEIKSTTSPPLPAAKARLFRLGELTFVDMEIPRSALLLQGTGSIDETADMPVHFVQCVAIRNDALGFARFDEGRLSQALRQVGLSKTDVPAAAGGVAGLELIEGTTPELQSLFREQGKEIFDTRQSVVIYRREKGE